MEENEVIKLLLEVNKDLTQQIVELAKELAKLQVVPVQVPMEASVIPLHVPETEEDAQFLLETGQIQKDQYEGMLKELQFFNSEITVPTA